MEEKELTFFDAPKGYDLCFNSECSRRNECMHYHIGTLVPPHKEGGPAVYPAAWKSGKCTRFHEKKLVRMAWGFNGLYKNLTKHEATEARQQVRLYFNMGKGEYYRYHNGQKWLTPQQQEDIRKLVALYGSLEGAEFDHYVIAYDFTW